MKNALEELIDCVVELQIDEKDHQSQRVDYHETIGGKYRDFLNVSQLVIGMLN
jgi:hypothetical protein